MCNSFNEFHRWLSHVGRHAFVISHLVLQDSVLLVVREASLVVVFTTACRFYAVREGARLDLIARNGGWMIHTCSSEYLCTFVGISIRRAIYKTTLESTTWLDQTWPCCSCKGENPSPPAGCYRCAPQPATMPFAFCTQKTESKNHPEFSSYWVNMVHTVRTARIVSSEESLSK